MAVIYPGRRAGGAGPDFRDAVIGIGGERRLGDVELHVRASSFAGHGHHLDPAYNRLALHVVFNDDGPGAVRLASGRSVPTAAFAPWVQSRQTRVEAWLTRSALWEEPCRRAGQRLSDQALGSILRAEGLERFERRRSDVARAAATVGLGQALWQALLDALAFGGDRDGFGRLASALPVELLRDLLSQGGWQAVEGALLAVAGVGAPQPADASLPRPLVPAVKRLGSRPANWPERRLAAAARLFGRAGGDLPAFARASVRQAATAKALAATWCVGTTPGRREALVGMSRSTEVLLNAVLPAVALTPDLRQRCRELAAGLKPLPPYGKTAFLEANLVQPDGKRRVKSALDQQGLLALHSDWCSQGGCGRCPLS